MGFYLFDVITWRGTSHNHRLLSSYWRRVSKFYQPISLGELFFRFYEIFLFYKNSNENSRRNAEKFADAAVREGYQMEPDDVLKLNEEKLCAFLRYLAKNWTVLIKILLYTSHQKQYISLPTLDLRCFLPAGTKVQTLAQDRSRCFYQVLCI